MPNDLLMRPDDLVSSWLTVASDTNPAGPLYGSSYAEYELIHEGRAETPASCSGCTASRPGVCC